MESARNLPMLPSERKAKSAEQDQPPVPDPDPFDSPTQVSRLESKASVGGCATEEPSSHHLSLENESPQVPDFDQHQKEKETRDEQISAFESIEPLPISSTAEKLLRFMNTTTSFINSLEMEVGQKLDSCSNKISTLDHKVTLIEKMQRHEPKTIQRDGSMTLENAAE
jgi:hypothetical protein